MGLFICSLPVVMQLLKIFVHHWLPYVQFSFWPLECHRKPEIMLLTWTKTINTHTEKSVKFLLKEMKKEKKLQYDIKNPFFPSVVLFTCERIISSNVNLRNLLMQSSLVLLFSLNNNNIADRGGGKKNKWRKGIRKALMRHKKIPRAEEELVLLGKWEM